MKGRFRKEALYLLALFFSLNILILLFRRDWFSCVGDEAIIPNEPLTTPLSALEFRLLSLPLLGPLVRLFTFLFGLTFMYPVASRLTKDGLIFVLLTVSLSLCVLTLLMFLMGMLDLLYLIPVLVICILIFLSQHLLFEVKTPKFSLPNLTLHEMCFLSLAFLVILILSFRTLYFPFIAADTLGRYGMEAKFMYLSRKLMSINDYPLLIPLSYLYTYMCFGGVHEHLAKLIDVIFMWMLASSTYLFGRDLFNKKVGLFSMLSLCLFSWFALGEPPTISQDGLEALEVPSAFFFSMSVFFLSRYALKKKGMDAELSGLMLGAGLWCKHALLIALPVLLFLAFLMILDKKIGSTEGPLIALLCSLLVCFSFYALNLRFHGYLFEQVVYIDTQFYRPIELSQILSNALMHREMLILFSLLALPVLLVRRESRKKAFFLLLPALVVFSYWFFVHAKISRYLFLIAPLLSVLSGTFLDELARRDIILTWVIIMLLLPEHLYYSLGKEVFLEVIKNPLMSEEDKRQLVLGDLYDLEKFLEENTTGGLYLMGDSLLMGYFLEGRKFGGWAPKSMRELEGYDFFVMDSSLSEDFFDYYVGNQTEVFDRLNDERYFKKLYNKGRFTVYEICFPECSFQE
ncbi:hypothetical protein DRN62_01065 [Nanoarchaeota archaeon]|nr:MAG: hypothetical protein DRN62_01065 [Nanoarchaeota archaeon]